MAYIASYEMVGFEIDSQCVTYNVTVLAPSRGTYSDTVRICAPFTRAQFQSALRQKAADIMNGQLDLELGQGDISDTMA